MPKNGPVPSHARDDRAVGVDVDIVTTLDLTAEDEEIVAVRVDHEIAKAAQGCARECPGLLVAATIRQARDALGPTALVTD